MEIPSPDRTSPDKIPPSAAHFIILKTKLAAMDRNRLWWTIMGM